jgi:hypothetical protein
MNRNLYIYIYIYIYIYNALTRPKPLHVGQTVGVAFCGYPCPSGLIQRKLLAQKGWSLCQGKQQRFWLTSLQTDVTIDNTDGQGYF